MAHLTGHARARYVQRMFARIAPRYDLMNRLMTAGQDAGWRQAVIERAQLPFGGLLLDLGAGTGDLAYGAARQRPDCQVVAADFTLEMMRAGQGRRQANGARLRWCAADALQLPFPAETFDAVISGFLLRNVSELSTALHEQRRVLKPGGRLVCLDTTQPPRSWLGPAIRLHLHTVIPALGQLLTGDRAAYTYLPNSTEEFLGAEQLAARLALAGFWEVGFQRFMFGTVALHWGRR